MKIAITTIFMVVVFGAGWNTMANKIIRLEKQVQTLQLQYDYIALELTSGKANIYKRVPRHITPQIKLKEK